MDLLDLSSLTGPMSAPFVIVVVETIKRRWPELPRRYIPLVNLTICLLLNAGYAPLHGLWRVDDGILIGIIVALTASGAYSGVRAVTEQEPVVTPPTMRGSGPR